MEKKFNSGVLGGVTPPKAKNVILGSIPLDTLPFEKVGSYSILVKKINFDKLPQEADCYIIYAPVILSATNILQKYINLNIRTDEYVYNAADNIYVVILKNRPPVSEQDLILCELIIVKGSWL